MHPDVMAALDLSPWDPVKLAGRRTTGAIVAEGGGNVPPGILLADDLILGNVGIADGTAVQVTKLALAAARTVEIAGDANVSRIVSPDMLRRALLGKMVTLDDNISLLPQENSMNGAIDQTGLEATRRQLRSLMGMQWTTTLLTVTNVDADGPALVTTGTTVSWRGGASAPGWTSSRRSTPLPASRRPAATRLPDGPVTLSR